MLRTDLICKVETKENLQISIIGSHVKPDDNTDSIIRKQRSKTYLKLDIGEYKENVFAHGNANVLSELVSRHIIISFVCHINSEIFSRNLD